MKYKYEFEVDEYFKKGCCYECPLSYEEYGDLENVHCVLLTHYEECPLIEVEE